MGNVIPLRRPAPPADPASVYLAQLAPGSRRAQGQALRVCERILGGDPLLLASSAAQIRAEVTRAYAPATARRILSAYRGVVKAAWSLGLLDADTRDRITSLAPVRGSRLPAGRALGEDEVARLWASSGREDALALALLLGAGLRREEAVGILAGNVTIAQMLRQGPEHMRRGPDWDVLGHPVQSDASQSPLVKGLQTNGEVRGQGPAGEGAGGASPVDEQPASVAGDRLRRRPLADTDPAPADLPAVRLAVFGKGSKERALYIAGHAATVLAVVAGRPGYVLSVRSGSGLWRRMVRLARRAGVPPFTPHDLRRTYASRALACVDLATVQATMGHADPRTTARYDRRGDDALRAAALTLASHTNPR